MDGRLQRKLKCRFCSFEVMPFWKSKKGETRTGHNRLQDHVKTDHPDEWARIQASLDVYEPVNSHF